MPTITAKDSIYVDASPEIAFENVSDLSRHPMWAQQDLKMDALSEGPVAVGSQYRSSAKFMGREMKAEIRVEEYEPASRFVFSTIDQGGSFNHEYIFRPQGSGTLIEHTVTGKVSLPVFLMFKVTFPIIGNRASAKTLQTMKSVVETSAS